MKKVVCTICFIALTGVFFSCNKREHTNPLDPANPNYKHTDTITDTPTITNTPTETSTPTPIPGFIDDFEDGDYFNLQNSSWFTFVNTPSSTGSMINETPGCNGTRAMHLLANLQMSVFFTSTFFTYYWAYSMLACTIDIDPTAWTNISFYAKGTLPSLPNPMNALYLYGDDGDFFTHDFTAEITGSWSYLDYSLASDFTPDGSNVHTAINMEAKLDQIYFYFLGWDFASGSSSLDFYLDDIRFY